MDMVGNMFYRGKDKKDSMIVYGTANCTAVAIQIRQEIQVVPTDR